MTLENTNFGSEYGVEKRMPGYSPTGVAGWLLLNPLGQGFETYEEAYQKALEYVETRRRMGYSYTIEFRVVVYDYDGSKRKNIRSLTVFTEDEK